MNPSREFQIVQAAYKQGVHDERERCRMLIVDAEPETLEDGRVEDLARVKDKLLRRIASGEPI